MKGAVRRPPWGLSGHLGPAAAITAAVTTRGARRPQQGSRPGGQGGSAGGQHPLVCGPQGSNLAIVHAGLLPHILPHLRAAMRGAAQANCREQGTREGRRRVCCQLKSQPLPSGSSSWHEAPPRCATAVRRASRLNSAAAYRRLRGSRCSNNRQRRRRRQGVPTWSMWRERNLVTRPRLCSRVPLLFVPVFLLLPEDPMAAALRPGTAPAAQQASRWGGGEPTGTCELRWRQPLLETPAAHLLRSSDYKGYAESGKGELWSCRCCTQTEQHVAARMRARAVITCLLSSKPTAGFKECMTAEPALPPIPGAHLLRGLLTETP